MKALLIATVLFFSLRAMSDEVTVDAKVEVADARSNESQKSDCIFANQGKRDSKIISERNTLEVNKEKSSSKSM